MISIYFQGADMDQVFCKDCRYSQNHWWALNGKFNYKCRRSIEPEKMDRVTGKVDPKFINACATARIIGQPCGPEGTLWEPKAKKDFFVFLRRV